MEACEPSGSPASSLYRYQTDTISGAITCTNEKSLCFENCKLKSQTPNFFGSLHRGRSQAKERQQYELYGWRVYTLKVSLRVRSEKSTRCTIHNLLSFKLYYLLIFHTHKGEHSSEQLALLFELPLIKAKRLPICDFDD